MNYTIEALLMPHMKKYHLTPLAGESGISNTVSWVYVSEDISTVKFLKKNELIITTGLFTQSGASLKSFIEAIILQHAAGIIINTGDYISENDISEEIRDLCNSRGLPLYTMPWEIRFTDILQALCSSLIEFSQKKNALSDAFIQILSSDTVDHCADILSQNGFGADSVYTVALCNGEDSETVAESISVSTPYTHTFRYNGYSVIVSVAENIILPEGPDLKAHTGISCARGGIDKIPALFKQAKDAMSAASIRGKAYENYKDIGVLALIFDALDKNELKRKALKRLAPILDYDSTHNSELIDTLFHYIRTGGSLAETARLTFTHRNTAGYRMNKLRELCGTDFSDVEERFNYLTMIYIVKAKL